MGNEIFNQFLVGARGQECLVILKPPSRVITKTEALILAAYLVALADPEGKRFAALLEQVKGT